MLLVLFTTWLAVVNWPADLAAARQWCPVVVAIALGFRRIARKVTRQARRATAAINAEIQESISGIMVAKGFRQERAVYEPLSGEQPARVPRASAARLCL